MINNNISELVKNLILSSPSNKELMSMLKLLESHNYPNEINYQCGNRPIWGSTVRVFNLAVCS